MENNTDSANSLVPEYPKIVVGERVHICNIDNFCMLGIIAGLTNTYEKDGKIVVFLMPPMPTAVATCLPDLPMHHKPANENDKKFQTWHTASECIGGCKRMITGPANRISLR